MYYIAEPPDFPSTIWKNYMKNGQEYEQDYNNEAKKASGMLYTALSGSNRAKGFDRLRRGRFTTQTEPDSLETLGGLADDIVNIVPILGITHLLEEGLVAQVRLLLGTIKENHVPAGHHDSSRFGELIGLAIDHNLYGFVQDIPIDGFNNPRDDLLGATLSPVKRDFPMKHTVDEIGIMSTILKLGEYVCSHYALLFPHCIARGTIPMQQKKQERCLTQDAPSTAPIPVVGTTGRNPKLASVATYKPS